MDCQTARTVWNHPEGFIAGVRATLPGVIERLEAQVAAYVRGDTNPYDSAVKRQSGVTSAFYSDHADTEDDPVAVGIHDVVGDAAGRLMLERYFTGHYGQPIYLGNLCCSSCITHDGTLLADDLLAIQVAPVNTEPDGSLFAAA